MKNKKAITIITLLCFFITLLPAPVFAATLGAKVTATIPTFKVTMNGQVVDNTYREYPFLVYNDVKYSLQGTTQGRYLTGGVPPVRFSM